MKLIKSADVIHIIDRTLSHVDSRLAGHGSRVSYIVLCVLKHLGTYSDKAFREAGLIALMHDIGAYKTEEIGSMMFEADNVWEHSLYGALFLQAFTPLDDVLLSVGLHHLPFEKYNTISPALPPDHLAGLLCLADRIDIYMRNHSASECLDHITALSGTHFSPYWIDAFILANAQFYIFGTLANGDYKAKLEEFISAVKFTQEEKSAYLSLIAYSIDFRSHFMVLHTITTVSVATAIAQIMNYSDEEMHKVRFGALLHDIGKVSIPVEILEKPDILMPDEQVIMRKHVEYSLEILDGYVSEEIMQIAVRHHEKMNGSGYPLGLTDKDLSVSERIVAVADILSALVRKRSYKQAFNKADTLKIIKSMSDDNLLDTSICTLVAEYFDEIIAFVDRYSADLLTKYEDIQDNYKKSLIKVYNNHENH